MNEAHYGYYVNCLWDAINMLTQMEKHKPNRFEEFAYSKATIYDYLDKIQNTYD